MIIMNFINSAINHQASNSDLLCLNVGALFDHRRSQGRIIVEQEGVPAKSDRSGG